MRRSEKNYEIKYINIWRGCCFNRSIVRSVRKELSPDCYWWAMYSFLGFFWPVKWLTVLWNRRKKIGVRPILLSKKILKNQLRKQFKDNGFYGRLPWGWKWFRKRVGKQMPFPLTTGNSSDTDGKRMNLHFPILCLWHPCGRSAEKYYQTA